MAIISTCLVCDFGDGPVVDFIDESEDFPPSVCWNTHPTCGDEKSRPWFEEEKTTIPNGGYLGQGHRRMENGITSQVVFGRKNIESDTTANIFGYVMNELTGFRLHELGG